MVNERDREILKKILKYCDHAVNAKERFGKNFSDFQNDEYYQAAVGMFIQQIGELAKRLSNDFTESNSEMPWREIKAMRNLFAHEYQHIDTLTVWECMNYDCPQLRAFCLKKLTAED